MRDTKNNNQDWNQSRYYVVSPRLGKKRLIWWAKRLNWWAKYLNWRLKSCFTQNSQLTPKLSCLTQNSSVVLKISLGGKKASLGVLKAWLQKAYHLQSHHNLVAKSSNSD